MTTLNMKKIKRIHFVGIGGAGMSGIAEVLAAQGYQVSGSDIAENPVIQHLENLGIKITLGHRAENIDGAEAVVYSGMIPKDNPELLAAEKIHLPVLHRAQMLAELMHLRFGIAIAGTHGKTTTTGLITALLTEGGLDPTYIIGGLLMSAGVHAHLGASKFFVAEADESDASFLYLQPKIIVVTNIDHDHLNHYEDFAHLRRTFIEFIHRLPNDGLAVLCSDDPIIREILPEISRPVLTYGLNESDDVYALNYVQEGTRCHVKVQRKHAQPLDITLNLPGRHNVLNALAAIAVATRCGVSDTAMATGLIKFQGTGRRFQIHGELETSRGKVLLIDDYGHHPREIAATLEAVRKAWPSRRLVVAFQPHRYSRTQAIFTDFVDVLALPDVLLLLDIYSAGEAPIPGVSGKILYDAVNKQRKHNNTVFVEQTQQLLQMLTQILQDGDVLLTQGAGDIGKLAAQLAQMGLRIDGQK